MVYKRLLAPPSNHSFFLFGARGTGKSTLLQSWIKTVSEKSSELLLVDLLDPETEEKYSRHPNALMEEIQARYETLKWCILDEIQKNPRLLDIVQSCIQKKMCHFALTGSSARKLKRNQANLLAGRAFDLRLFPLSIFEVGTSYSIDKLLRYGSLPEIFSLDQEKDKIRFLDSYIRTYLREEIQIEQIVRDVTKFRQFLHFAGQMNTKVLNFSKIAKTSGVDQKSVSRYFEILEDTLIGIFLEPTEKSIRQRQKQKPKFYLFDTGLACQMREDFSGELRSGSSIYGEIFEQWFVLECHRLNEYLEKRDSFSYFSTKDDVEVDLIIHRRGVKPILVEIKSTSQVTEYHARHLESVKKDFAHSRALIVCQEKTPRKLSNGIEIIPYAQALKELYF